MTSPFSEGRFEHEAKHLYYLPRSCFPQLEQPRPTYLIGSRGSGKTTLMKALHWAERLENGTLRRQLGDLPFRGMFIGNYVKLPTIQLNCFDDWLDGAGETNYGLLFGLYIDLTCLELISHSVGELLARRAIKIPASTEGHAVASWFEDYPDFQCFHQKDRPQSVSQFRARIRDIRRALERHALQKMPVERTFAEFHVDQIGSFASSLAKKLGALCEMDETPRHTRWHFKVCMDEGESLNLFQQRVINTLIRLSEWPLFHVVSYVSRPDDMTTTLAPHLTQQQADRQVIVLDDLDRNGFQELAEGVATARCQEALQDSSITFDTRRALGSLNVNRMLKPILERSESPRARQILERATQSPLRASPSGDPPIYETYLADQLGLSESSDTRQEQRRVESVQYRKKMVGAYLSICRELKLKHVTFASGDVVLSVSDNCVRDFLSQLHYVFVQSGWTLREFLEGEVDWEMQAGALREASLDKRDSIPESGVLSPIETGRVVKGLARITANIQSGSEDKRHLRSTERGLFQLSFLPSEQPDAKRVLTLVQDAADAGFLRVREEGGQVKSFRVHCSLAPAYGFSYRGAYYAVTITLSDFSALMSAESDQKLSELADVIAERLSRQPSGHDMPLFEGWAE